MLERMLDRFGLAGTTAAITLAAAVSSVALTNLATLVWFGELSWTATAFAAVVPTVVAPVFIFVQLRLILELQAAREQLRRLSVTDDLTESFNRRYFLDAAGRELVRAKRYGSAFSIVLLDLDDFKEVNDRFGHLAGDQVLRELSAACRIAIRSIDVFARYGGEEFVLLLPHTAATSAVEIAERLRRRIAETAFDWNGHTIRLAASLGVVTYPDGARSTLDALLFAADEALYAAKRAGKNRVVEAPTGTAPPAVPPAPLSAPA